MEEVMKMDQRHKWKQVGKTKLSIIYCCSACGKIFKGITQEQLSRILCVTTKRMTKRLVETIFSPNTLFKRLLERDQIVIPKGKVIVWPVRYERRWKK